MPMAKKSNAACQLPGRICSPGVFVWHDKQNALWPKRLVNEGVVCEEDMVSNR